MSQSVDAPALEIPDWYLGQRRPRTFIEELWRRNQQLVVGDPAEIGRLVVVGTEDRPILTLSRRPGPHILCEHAVTWILLLNPPAGETAQEIRYMVCRHYDWEDWVKIAGKEGRVWDYAAICDRIRTYLTLAEPMERG